MIKPRKIGIIGMGHVGSHCAFSLITQGACDELVLVDIDKDKCRAQAVDLQDALPYLNQNIRIRAAELEDCADAQIVVLCAGPLPRPDQTRLDTLADCLGILRDVVPPIVASGFDGIFVVITNPCDIITHYVWEASGFPKNRVFGTGTALDSARLRRATALALDVAPQSVQAFSLGEHGDSQIVPWSTVTIGGKPLLQLMGEQPESYGRADLDAIAKRSRMDGMVAILPYKGSTEFGISTALVEIVKTIFSDGRKIMPASVLLEGEYAQQGLHASVPVILGRNGVEEIVQLSLTDAEQAGFNKSCDVIREYIRAMHEML